MEYNFDEQFFDAYKHWKEENKDKCLICGNPRYNYEYICNNCRNKQYALQKQIYKEIEDNSLFQTVNSYILNAATDNLINTLCNDNQITTIDLLKIVAMAYIQKYDFFFDGLYNHLPINIYLLKKSMSNIKKTILITDNNQPNKRCNDGHKVRSNGEVEIDNWLYLHNYAHAYEPKYPTKDGNFYMPDFYVPTLNLYIEYFGLLNEQYEQKTKNKLLTYSKDKEHNFIFIYSNEDIIQTLSKEIKRIQNNSKNA